ncbi:chromosome segregation protein SMC [Heyndrickxia shackletonii]|uniref:Chromosome partition protein Smc n=1 Tax=Heyndrickxia shackletonii TaxID=157838 RepID=A0A0Q3WZ96_9BACI|nr:chromosome segregation protein SMC [Heyndrickxia shackletonii]KQL54661.1 chromosome segregation protein SMC [Heyndrickxia shackletonii]NEY98311.1 chromosome segregation protein SMC [Heyndrickxia shackletonii]
MFLKRLDIVGFKSFAERISVDFVKGVTAVVGPNGSGKSNIIDAVRWVLGEQSAKSLRGGKMEDVIFAGSDTRKSLNFAEVSLTLDNEDHQLPLDYNEVSVTRRVYRSGDSEFYINKQSCRLKDIVDLFMDSGLGREAFSIISQGKVEEILNSKPEERRTIFEEAAGVLKYKTRKKKAETKLNETQENLNRVNDILHELEHQVEPLKIQASLARDYLEKKEELKNVEVGLTVKEIEALNENWEHLKKQLEQHQDQELASLSKLQKEEAKLAEMRDHLSALDESISDLQNVLVSATEELEKLEGRKEVLKERKKNANHNKDQLQRNIMESADKLKKLEEQKQILKAEYDRNVAEASLLKASLKEKNDQLNKFNINLDEVIESLKGDYIELLNEQASGKNELNLLGQQLQVQSSKKNKLDEDNKKYIEQRKIILEEKQNVEKQLNEVAEELDAHIHKFRDKQKKLENLKNQYEKQESTLYQAYQYLQKAKSRKETLEEMEEDYTGFFQGVREVLKAKGTVLGGIEGAVAELIQVPKGYESAMDTALGGAMQHIVVLTEENGRNAIQYLKKNRYGRATFLPLNVIKGKSIPFAQLELISGDPSFVGVAAELIQVDAKYQSIISNLLGNVVITKDLQGANRIAKLLQYRYRLVTLDGDVVNPGGSMTGGTLKQSSNSLISRKGELEELKEKLISMEEKTSQLENLVKTIKQDVAQEENSLEEMRKHGEQLRFKEQEWKAELRQIEMAEKNMNERLMIYDMEKAESLTTSESVTARIQELEEQLKSVAEKITGLETEIEELTRKKNNDISSKDEVLNEISDLKSKLAVKNEQLVTSRENLERIQGEYEETLKKHTQFTDELNWIENEMSNNHSGEEEISVAAEKKRMDKLETTNLISMRREERVQLQTKLEDMELNLKELNRQHKGIVEVLKDEEVKINRLDVDLENRLARLREEYLLSFEAAKQDFPLDISLEDARKKVKLIKLAIEELGTVNIGAIEEYDRVSERYEFLKEQQTDLLDAKETLFQVIDEMDEEMKRRFEETFAAIRLHFEPTFQALFGGGRAELKLTEPNDLLNTGVDIVAQPPGKKLQNLGLLSGGERALTAIALLFSILKVRPVPFCILDEVEAALDEANVFRFSKYLKKFSEETQFIVITHRKGTMEEADVLYGITMQESGVSKLVSVRLEDTNELVGPAMSV